MASPTVDEIYRPNDTVWVKLSSMWWPAAVQDQASLDPEVTEGLKKPPLVVVRFLTEDSYEFVKSYDQIYHYNCKRKEEFLKLGFRKYSQHKNEKNMAKYPEVIQEAERLTGGDPDIVNDPTFNPSVDIDDSEDNVGRKRRSSFDARDKLIGRHSLPIDAREGNHLNEGRRQTKSLAVGDEPGSTTLQFIWVQRQPPPDDPSRDPVVPSTCAFCKYTTTNFDLLMVHYRRYRFAPHTAVQSGQSPWSERKLKRAKRRSEKKSKESRATPALKKRKKKVVGPLEESTPVKKKKKVLPNASTLDVSQQLTEELLKDWDEEEDMLNDTTLSNDEMNDMTAEDSALNESNKDRSLNNIFEGSMKACISSPPQTKLSSCFDFDDDEPPEPDLQTLKFGQKLPRLISPEKSKSAPTPDALGDDLKLDDFLQEVSVPQLPDLPQMKQASSSRDGASVRTLPSSKLIDPVVGPIETQSDGNAPEGTNTVSPSTEKHLISSSDEMHFLAEGPLQSKKRKCSGLIEGAEDGSASSKKVKGKEYLDEPSMHGAVDESEVSDSRQLSTAPIDDGELDAVSSQKVDLISDAGQTLSGEPAAGDLSKKSEPGDVDEELLDSTRKLRDYSTSKSSTKRKSMRKSSTETPNVEGGEDVSSQNVSLPISSDAKTERIMDESDSTEFKRTSRAKDVKGTSITPSDSPHPEKRRSRRNQRKVSNIELESQDLLQNALEEASNGGEPEQTGTNSKISMEKNDFLEVSKLMPNTTDKWESVLPTSETPVKSSQEEKSARSSKRLSRGREHSSEKESCDSKNSIIISGVDNEDQIRSELEPSKSKNEFSVDNKHEASKLLTPARRRETRTSSRHSVKPLTNDGALSVEDLKPLDSKESNLPSTPRLSKTKGSRVSSRLSEKSGGSDEQKEDLDQYIEKGQIESVDGKQRESRASSRLPEKSSRSSSDLKSLDSPQPNVEAKSKSSRSDKNEKEIAQTLGEVKCESKSSHLLEKPVAARDGSNVPDSTSSLVNSRESRSSRSSEKFSSGITVPKTLDPTQSTLEAKSSRSDEIKHESRTSLRLSEKSTAKDNSKACAPVEVKQRERESRNSHSSEKSDKSVGKRGAQSQFSDSSAPIGELRYESRSSSRLSEKSLVKDDLKAPDSAAPVEAKPRESRSSRSTEKSSRGSTDLKTLSSSQAAVDAKPSRSDRGIGKQDTQNLASDVLPPSSEVRTSSRLSDKSSTSGLSESPVEAKSRESGGSRSSEKLSVNEDSKVADLSQPVADYSSKTPLRTSSRHSDVKTSLSDTSPQIEAIKTSPHSEKISRRDPRIRALDLISSPTDDKRSESRSSSNSTHPLSSVESVEKSSQPTRASTRHSGKTVDSKTAATDSSAQLVDSKPKESRASSRSSEKLSDKVCPQSPVNASLQTSKICGGKTEKFTEKPCVSDVTSQGETKLKESKSHSEKLSLKENSSESTMDTKVVSPRSRHFDKSNKEVAKSRSSDADGKQRKSSIKDDEVKLPTARTSSRYSDKSTYKDDAKTRSSDSRADRHREARSSRLSEELFPKEKESKSRADSSKPEGVKHRSSRTSQHSDKPEVPKDSDMKCQTLDSKRSSAVEKPSRTAHISGKPIVKDLDNTSQTSTDEEASQKKTPMIHRFDLELMQAAENKAAKHVKDKLKGVKPVRVSSIKSSNTRPSAILPDSPDVLSNDVKSPELATMLEVQSPVTALTDAQSPVPTLTEVQSPVTALMEVQSPATASTEVHLPMTASTEAQLPDILSADTQSPLISFTKVQSPVFSELISSPSPNENPEMREIAASPEQPSAPLRASRWDNPYPMKKGEIRAPTPTNSSVMSPSKLQRSPVTKAKVEYKSGLGRKCFKSPPLESRCENIPEPPECFGEKGQVGCDVKSNSLSDVTEHTSDDELNALRAEILSYTRVDGVPVSKVGDGVEVGSIEPNEKSKPDTNGLTETLSIPTTLTSPAKKEEQANEKVLEAPSVGHSYSEGSKIGAANDISSATRHEADLLASVLKGDDSPIPVVGEGDLNSTSENPPTIDESVHQLNSEPGKTSPRQSTSKGSDEAFSSSEALLASLLKSSDSSTDSCSLSSDAHQSTSDKSLSQTFSKDQVPTDKTASKLVTETELGTGQQSVFSGAPAEVKVLSSQFIGGAQNAQMCFGALDMDLDINSMPIVIEEDFLQEEGCMSYPVNPPNSSTSIPIHPSHFNPHTIPIVSSTATNEATAETQSVDDAKTTPDDLLKDSSVPGSGVNSSKTGKMKVYEARLVHQYIIDIVDSEDPNFEYYLSLPAVQQGKQGAEHEAVTPKPSSKGNSIGVMKSVTPKSRLGATPRIVSMTVPSSEATAKNRSPTGSTLVKKSPNFLNVNNTRLVVSSRTATISSIGNAKPTLVAAASTSPKASLVISKPQGVASLKSGALRKTVTLKSVRRASPSSIHLTGKIVRPSVNNLASEQSVQGKSDTSPVTMKSVRASEPVKYIIASNRTSSGATEKKIVIIDKKPPVLVAPGQDILAKALASTDLLPSDTILPPELVTERQSDDEDQIIGEPLVAATSERPVISSDRNPVSQDSVSRTLSDVETVNR